VSGKIVGRELSLRPSVARNHRIGTPAERQVEATTANLGLLRSDTGRSPKLTYSRRNPREHHEVPEQAGEGVEDRYVELGCPE
jgi:hypothetical protein